MSLASAIRTRDLAELPSRRDEDWRWSGLRALFRVMPPASPAVEVVQSKGPFHGLANADVIIANGRLNWWPDDDQLPNGLRIATHDEPAQPLLTSKLPMALQASVNAHDPKATIWTVAGGEARSIGLRFISVGSSTSHAARVGFVVEAGASLVLLESYEAEGSDYFSNVLLEFFVGEGARVERIVIADDAVDAVSVSTSEVHLAHGANFAQTVLASGAKRQRIETHVRNPGSGSHVRLDGAYLLGGPRHSDQTTVLTHQGLGGVSSQLVKGVVADRARAVFQGKIIVARGADGTDARMGSHAILLSDRAEVDAKPELEIYADDVQCAHGNTAGALDDAALFYARQRGIPEVPAKAMLTAAFVGEVVERVVDDGAREMARAWVEMKLAGLV